MTVPPGVKTKRVAALLSCFALPASGPVLAAGFGTPTVSAVMGQRLQITVPLTLEEGEQIGPECVSAEVVSGESRLASDQVRVQIEPPRDPLRSMVRISTYSPVEEPVLQVRLSVGCGSRFLRQFTVLADPPGRNPTSAVPSAMPNDAASLPSAGTASLGPASRPSRAHAATRRASAPRPGGAAAQPGSPAAKAKSAALASPGDPAKRAGKTRAPQARLVLDMGSGPSLKWDLEEPIFMGTAPATASVAAASAVDNAAEQRIGSLQRSLGLLERERTLLREANQKLKDELNQNQSTSTLWPWLAGLFLLATLGLGALWWRAVPAGRGARSWWAVPQSPDSDVDADTQVLSHPQNTAAFNTAPTSDFESLDDSPIDVTQSAAGAPAANRLDWVSSAPPPPAVPPLPEADVLAHTTVIFEPLQAPAREVSVEELLDQEQQADFFIALGQDEAAIDLLMASLDSVGGESPVPYNKLLEIHRRRGDHAAYEVIRRRFNRRFNVFLPAWEMDPLPGRWLEDYPAAVWDLQAAWPSPLDAMAHLEAMLFRKGEHLEVFDQPANQDLMLLYAIARELWQLAGGKVDEVDLLLPLNSRGATGADPAGLTAETLFNPPSPDLVDLDFDLDAPPPAAARATAEAEDQHGVTVNDPYGLDVIDITAPEGGSGPLSR